MSLQTIATREAVFDGLERAVPTGRTVGRVALVITIYTAVFFVVLPGALWMLGGRLDELFRLSSVPAAWTPVGSVAFGSGAVLLLWSVACLRRYGCGWPISHLPPRRLVRQGPYAVMRHPIYVGYTVAFAGAGLYAGSFGRGVLAAGLLALGSTLYALGFEEPRLTRRYGAEYEAQRAATAIFRVLPGRPLRTALRRAASTAWNAVRVPLQSFSNHTVLFRVGPTIWVTYGACVAIGTLVMAVGLAAALIDAGVPTGAVAAYVVGLAAAMLLGGRAVWLLYQLGARPPRLMRRVGFVSWGGYVTLLGGAVGFARLAGLDALWLLDRTLFWGFLASGFGRLGCASYGCCYGRAAAWGIRWSDPNSKIIREHGAEAGIPRIPTQLFAACLAFGIAALLAIASRTAPPAGALAGVGMLVYALGRFAIDCLRQEPRFGSWQLTSGQIGAALLGVVGLAILLAVDGSPSWSAPAYSVSLFAAPIVWGSVLSTVTMVWVVCSLHWREVGRW